MSANRPLYSHERFSVTQAVTLMGDDWRHSVAHTLAFSHLDLVNDGSNDFQRMRLATQYPYFRNFTAPVLLNGEWS